MRDPPLDTSRALNLQNVAALTAPARSFLSITLCRSQKGAEGFWYTTIRLFAVSQPWCNPTQLLPCPLGCRKTHNRAEPNPGGLHRCPVRGGKAQDQRCLVFSQPRRQTLLWLGRAGSLFQRNQTTEAAARALPKPWYPAQPSRQGCWG